MKVSDYIVKTLEDEGVGHVFLVPGGPIMHIMDSLDRNKNVRYICMQHEQASAIAADGYQRISKNLGVALSTTGPGGTNMITGTVCAWMDSLPTLFISGQVNSKSIIGDTGVRQRGVHEVDIVRIVKPVTKYAVTVTDPKTIRYHLEKALFLARSGRPGPVWLDIPINVQAVDLDPATLQKFEPEKEFPPDPQAEKKVSEAAAQAVKLLKEAKRPIIVCGHGVRLSDGISAFRKLVDKLHVPVVCTKNGYDILEYDHPCFVGMAGINAYRSANLAVQASDLLIVLGSRLAIPFTGYETQLFAPHAKRLVVDIDPVQLAHANVRIDTAVQCDVKTFIDALLPRLDSLGKFERNAWLARCMRWKQKYYAVLPDYANETRFVNAYYFFDRLSDAMPGNAILVTDQGATFYCPTQVMRLKKGQRMFTNGGFSAMGYGLPSAIGACFANGEKDIICVHGDGGLQLNIHELQTIVHYKLPIKLFVFNNNGYVSIKHTMMTYFGKLIACDPSSGFSCPDTIKIAAAYGLPSERIANSEELRTKLKGILQRPGPVVVEVMIDPMQPYEPKVQSEKLADGTMVSKPIDDMHPYLSREEYAAETKVD